MDEQDRIDAVWRAIQAQDFGQSLDLIAGHDAGSARTGEFRALKVKTLIQAGDADGAEAALAELAGLAERHPDLDALAAETVMARGHAVLAQAWREIDREHFAEALRVIAAAPRVPGLAGDFLALKLRVLVRMGDLDGAEAALAGLADLPDGYRPPAGLEAEIAIARGDNARAIAILAAAHARAMAKGNDGVRPDDRWHGIALAHAYFRAGDLANAVATTAQMAARAPHDRLLVIEHAAMLRRAGEIEEAGRRLSDADAQWPDDATIQVHRGELADARGDHDAAIPFYAAAARLEPDILAHRTRYAAGLVRVGRLDDALDALEAAREAFPQAAGLLAEIVELRVRRGEPEDAADALDELAALYPDHVRSHGLNAAIAELVGDDDAAERHLRRQASQFPADASRRVDLAEHLRRAGKRRAAFDLVARLEAPTPQSLLLRAMLALELGRFDDCRATLADWPQTRADSIERWRIEMRLAAAEFRFGDVRTAATHVLADRPFDEEATWEIALAQTMTFDAKVAVSTLRAAPVRPPGGGPVRPSRRTIHGLVGHVTNEFRLRDAQVRRLSMAARFGGQAVRRETTDILRDDPQSTPAALILLTELARAGELDRGEADGPAAIPPLLHQYWDRDLPEDVAALIARTQGANPQLQHRLWDDKAARDFLGEMEIPDWLRAYRAARHPAVRADLFRLALLWRSGGVYMDADDLAIGPIAPRLGGGRRLIGYQELYGTIGNNFMAAAPGHPLIRAMLDEAAAEILAGGSDPPWLSTGPALVSRVVAGAVARDADALDTHGVRIWPLHGYRAIIQAGRKVGYKTGRRNWMNAS